MTDEPGFEIEGVRYAFPTRFRLGDPVLVTSLTGMAWDDFTDALDDPEKQFDPIVLLGLIGVAFSQANPRWRIDKVVTHLQQLDFDKVEYLGGEDEPEGDALPPAATSEDGAGNSTASDEASSASAATTSDETPSTTGLPGSDTTSRSSHLAA